MQRGAATAHLVRGRGRLCLHARRRACTRAALGRRRCRRLPAAQQDKLLCPIRIDQQRRAAGQVHKSPAARCISHCCPACGRAACCHLNAWRRAASCHLTACRCPACCDLTACRRAACHDSTLERGAAGCLGGRRRL